MQMPDSPTLPPDSQSEATALEQLVAVRTREASGLATHLQELAEKEKSEIARTLHDELGGLLTAAKMDLSWLQSRVKVPEFQERLAQLGSVLDEAMDLKRRVVDDLRPSLLDHFGLPTALRTYFAAACAKASLKGETDIADEAQTLPRETAIAVFRIVEEGLNNIIRHADAKHVRLSLSADREHFGITLVDDGCGFDPEAHNESVQAHRTFGLMGMRQRVRSFGGTLAIDSVAGLGTTVKLVVPVQ